MIRNDIIEEAMSWLNTPYHHQGRVKGAGVDCAMILAEVYHEVGLIPYIDTPAYPRDWHMHRSEEKYLGFITQYAHEVDRPKMGDVVLFKFGRCVSHAGIVVEWPQIIHSFYKGGVKYDDGLSGELGGRLHGFYSLLED